MGCVRCVSTNIKKLGRSRTGFQRHYCKDCGKAWQEYPDPRRLTEEDKATACRLYEEGLSARAVARALGKGVTSTWAFLKKSAKTPVASSGLHSGA